MKDISSIILEQLNDLHFDCLVQSAVRDPRVLTEATKSLIPSKEELAAFAKSKKGIFTLSVLSIVAVNKISNAIYKLYLKAKLPQCAKILNNTARRQCIIHYKILACKKTIEGLKGIRNEKNKENIDSRINQVIEKINKLKKKQIDTGLTF